MHEVDLWQTGLENVVHLLLYQFNHIAQMKTAIF